ncbi:MAG: hypothetical protein C4517_04035 [Stygiobacter sp.]|nr:MAG: hypothetical protein C4517_04035 [Stygiobacter sp.]
MLNSHIKNLIAKRHIAGTNLEQAEKFCKWSTANGWATTISAWTLPSESKQSVAKKYIEIIKTISRNGFDSYVSIKPSALEFDMKLFEHIVKEVPDKNIRIHFDSLSPDLAEKSLQYFKQVKTIYDNVGYTIPSRWPRSLSDAKEIARMNVPVRIVKGQWQDPDDFKLACEKNYLKMISILINETPLIAIATHDKHLAEKAMGLFEGSETAFELEQFFSLPQIGEAIQSRYHYNFKIRFYVAYGVPYIPYNLKDVNMRPAMISWFVRDLFNLKQRFNLASTSERKFNHEVPR